MQYTYISFYSIKSLLRLNSQGIKLAVYTVKPGFSNGLLLTDKKPININEYIGYKINV